MRKLHVATRHADGGRAVIVVRGRLDARTRERVADAMWRAATSGATGITVDLSRMTHFDSDSLLTLLGIERLASRQLHCEIDLTGVETAMARLLASDDPAARRR